MITVLPDILPSAFAGILIAVMINAIGGGLLGVLVSPVVEACPSDNKEGAMNMLHSFYCWGHAGVVLLSTLFFHIAGIENRKLLIGRFGRDYFSGAAADWNCSLQESEKGISKLMDFPRILLLKALNRMIRKFIKRRFHSEFLPHANQRS